MPVHKTSFLRHLSAFFVLFLLTKSVGLNAQSISVNTFRYVGPFPVQTPLMVDSLDVNGKTFNAESLLDMPLRTEDSRQGRIFEEAMLPATQGKVALHLLAFNFTNTGFAKAKMNVEGLQHHRIFLDGAPLPQGEIALQPTTHEVVIKALTTDDKRDSIKVSITSDEASKFLLTAQKSARTYTLDDVLHAKRYTQVELSPNGRWAIVSTAQTQKGGQAQRTTEVRDVKTGQVLDHRNGAHWMPVTNQYYEVRERNGQRELLAIDPLTRDERVLARDLPKEYFNFVPTEDKLIFTLTDEGPKENPQVYEVIHPDDRQPNWRDRTHLAIYDLKTGLMQPLTYGHTQTRLADMTDDGRYALVSTYGSRLGERPTEVSSAYRIDLTTLTADTIFHDEGFMGNICLSPDGKQVLATGSPEAFDGIGKNVREGQTPSMIDMQLFLIDIATRKTQPLTRTFNPNVGAMEWSKADGMIYFSAEDKDSVNLFRMNPKTGAISQIALPEEVVERFALATQEPLMVFYGQSASNSDRLYAIDLKKACSNKAKDRNNATRLLEDLSAETLQDIELGDCKPYTYINKEGDSICCRYYLPPHFDANKRYPMIVNYYGGCSPTSRNFETRYPQHAYAALGYVVLVVNPRGATGFGQEWSAHHVNTAGEGVAEDIIGAVKSFCQANAWVNEKKIGCIGASYGGFMTQYLQTKTDLFAAAISHAGISDHTSYWGEGYWGYNYSEVSMANSYPWTRKDLFVEQSPLFHADKVHTPLLFLHGDSDHNVPVGESIQMYTALKLLGRPTAMVLVKDADHHITEYESRHRWQATIWAWFARWLQDDESWWQDMYPNKDL